jgi:hypothetical protein
MPSEVTPDDRTNPIAASSVSSKGSTLKIAFDANSATYEGIVSENHNSFRGTLTQGAALPLDLERSTAESSWRRDQTTPPETSEILAIFNFHTS